MAEWLYAAFPDEPEGQLSPSASTPSSRGAVCAAGRARIGVPPTFASASRARRRRRPTATMCWATWSRRCSARSTSSTGSPAARTSSARWWGDRVRGAATAPQHPKSALQEWAAANRRKPPTYEIIDRSGPDHAPRFTVAGQRRHATPRPRPAAASRRPKPPPPPPCSRNCSARRTPSGSPASPAARADRAGRADSSAAPRPVPSRTSRLASNRLVKLSVTRDPRRNGCVFTSSGICPRLANSRRSSVVRLPKRKRRIRRSERAIDPGRALPIPAQPRTQAVVGIARLRLDLMLRLPARSADRRAVEQVEHRHPRRDRDRLLQMPGVEQRELHPPAAAAAATTTAAETAAADPAAEAAAAAPPPRPPSPRAFALRPLGRRLAGRGRCAVGGRSARRAPPRCAPSPPLLLPPLRSRWNSSRIAFSSAGRSSGFAPAARHASTFFCNADLIGTRS